jgi:hypothetical protein
MDNIKHIRELLKKFYEGESGKREELELEEYFNNSKTAPEFDDDKKLFLSLKTAHQEVDIPLDLEKNILNTIKQAEISELKIRRISLYSLSGLAAGLLIILTIYLGIIKEDQYSRVMAQYTIEDPERAYNEVKNALNLVSEKWNSGTRQLSKLDEVNRGMESISTINKISSGSKEINLLGNLRKADNISIQ